MNVHFWHKADIHYVTDHESLTNKKYHIIYAMLCFILRILKDSNHQPRDYESLVINNLQHLSTNQNNLINDLIYSFYCGVLPFIVLICL
jgi:hypothetical protein